MAMRAYPFRTPYLIKKLFSGPIWKVNSPDEKTIYLTFDDGPDPEVTPYVLDLLEQYEAKATFFVVGANAKKYPHVLQRIHANGHAIGNHTQQHLSGWRTAPKKYYQDVILCQQTLSQVLDVKPKHLFRPPYGRITPGQIRSLKQKYEIVMWSVLSGDFDTNLNVGSAKRALVKSGAGEIIVFHDSQKSLPNLKQLLPWFLECFHSKGYKFAALSPRK